MKLTFYGTRGSSPIANTESVKYGGNTTCVRLESPCLHEAWWLVIDAGTGILPLSTKFLQEKGLAVGILFTHFHPDHTQGFPLSAFPYLKRVPVHLFGPYEHGTGPREVLQTIMKPPLFPVDYREYGSHIHCHNLEFPNSTVLLIHPEGGIKTLNVDAYERLIGDGRQMPFKSGAYHAQECLVVRMHRSHHPEQTISYRFEEGPTGEIFVFVTDHENEDGLPTSFRQHLSGAHLLVMDCQYTRKKYEGMTAGWGHGTPDYVARVAQMVGAQRVGLTHHDPFSNDATVDEIVATAQRLLTNDGINVFGCQDYQVVNVK